MLDNFLDLSIKKSDFKSIGGKVFGKKVELMRFT